MNAGCVNAWVLTSAVGAVAMRAQLFTTEASLEVNQHASHAPAQDPRLGVVRSSVREVCAATDAKR